MQIAEVVLNLLGVYALIGIVFSAVFVTAGLRRIDPDAAHITRPARLLLMPGAAVLWPLMAWKWLSVGKATR